MKNLKDIIAAIEKSSYDMEAGGFRGQEPSGAQSWCEDYFNKQSLKYKLERVSFVPDDEADLTDIKWIIDFHDVLNEYWQSEGYSIDSGYYEVTLNVYK